MIRISFLLLLGFGMSACQTNSKEEPKETEEPKAMFENLAPNLLSTLAEKDMSPFKWLNPPTNFTLSEEGLFIEAQKGTDFFCDPVELTVTATAPLLYQPVRGDFVASTLVKPDFSTQWNACALMAYIDSTHWIKFAFERSDATGKSIVSVVSNGVSDDANGVILEDKEQIYLRLIKRGTNYSMLWSTDGMSYKMARLAQLPFSDTIKVGVEAQSPLGPMARHHIMYFSLEKRSVDNLREGI